ncbi:hypothetical protein C9374_008977 [Naegleria lovaniensis]|uniref:MHD domain-containing protein n=1 Tax=Naegleria lovaniensis TaxID=51637 RepID=A0AA88KEY7_NAELO|nr:uncharacterized protein C9374_008977 [Naegleria lovaniensis]KAG2377892.1 hypothetical protein C9374_008977 [Naegleria lovaniensis]
MSQGPSAYYILDLKGKNIIHRDFRGNLPRNIIDKFVRRVIKEEDENIQPVFEEDGYSFCFIQKKDLYFVMVANCNCNAMEMVCFLYESYKVFEDYFKEVEEESIKDNFVVVYELLDEMMDFGYPQSTEPKILQEFIKNESHKLQQMDTFKFWTELMGLAVDNGNGGQAINLQQLTAGLQTGLSMLTKQLQNNLESITKGSHDVEENTSKITIPRNFTQAISWRKEGILYKKNECFLDVIESVNILVSNSGTTLRSQIEGRLNMRVFLSGMPDLKLGLNDKVLFENLGKASKRSVDLEDVKFHQCVRLNKFETDRIISFVPPDGEFDLMTYRLSTRIKPLILVECHATMHGSTRVEYSIKAKAQFKNKSTANNVKIFIPVPKDADSPIFNSMVGHGDYVPEEDCICWTIKQFPGGKEFTCHAEVGLPTMSSEESQAELSALANTSTRFAEALHLDKQSEESESTPKLRRSFVESRKRPIRVAFEIPYFTVSGLQVRYLKIMDKTGYSALPWVRYITTSGTYEIRQ